MGVRLRDLLQSNQNDLGFVVNEVKRFSENNPEILRFQEGRKLF